MQHNLFGEIALNKLTVEQAAKTANVSTATIRNWIKTGYLEQVGKGIVTQSSLDSFMANVAGKEKLQARANKRQKKADTSQTLPNIATWQQTCPSEDLGMAYEQTLSDAYRNQEGIYYTPAWIVEDLFKHVKIDKHFTFLDPCCGSGNFIVEALRQGISPENIHGFDVDEHAIWITKVRVRQMFGVELPHVKLGDFLQEALLLQQAGLSFDLILTNPPWGKKIDIAHKKRFASQYACGNSLDTTSLFMGAGLFVLKQAGYLGFLMQEAFFNITAFEDIRKKVLCKKITHFLDYGKAFQGLMTKAQAVVLQNEPSNLQDKIICEAHNTAFERSVSSFQHNPKTIFNFSTHAEEAQVINRLYASKHITLKNKAKWALGIVTGNNDRFCSKTPKTGYVPIYKGSDITKSGLKEPNTFILNDFSNFQQVASLDMYHAQEKLIYKFISSDLCFFCDTEQRYMLNSANMLIPTGIGISGAQLTQLLNSDIINWLFKKLFATHKILRGDLELLPIHSDYFLHHQEFSASSYLDYLHITKTEHGTFSIKK
jgi:site-specific DNA-methyltransferase (adenine-specific)